MGLSLATYVFIVLASINGVKAAEGFINKEIRWFRVIFTLIMIWCMINVR